MDKVGLCFCTDYKIRVFYNFLFKEEDEVEDDLIVDLDLEGLDITAQDDILDETAGTDCHMIITWRSCETSKYHM